MTAAAAASEVTPFEFRSASTGGTATWYLRPAVEPLLPPLSPGTRVLDLGCGNGEWVGWFATQGCVGVGVDPSASGIAIARKHVQAEHPSTRFETLLATPSVLQTLGEQPFDLVVSFEVVEHVYSAHEWAETCRAALRPGGRLICSTPYHGYLKNLTLALAGKWDHHHQPLKDGGHVKFWARDTLTQLLTEHGFDDITFRGAGRTPYLWKSMILSATAATGPGPAADSGSRSRTAGPAADSGSGRGQRVAVGGAGELEG